VSVEGEGREGYLMPTLRRAIDGLKSRRDDGTAEEETVPSKTGTSNEEAEDDDEQEEDEDEEESDSATFSTFPQPQNVFRCPPVNWAKYQVVGESLDKLHEEQRQRPTSGQPVQEVRADGEARSAPYIIAAPYQPVVDAARMAQHPMQTRRGSKKSI
jgi:hypothetical protein